MIKKITRIGLCSGLFLTISSFLFFGRQHEVYQLLLFGGFFISLICFAAILRGKETTKSKLIWSAVLFVGFTIHWLAEPFLIKSSFLIYLNRNEVALTSVNDMLKDKSGDILILGNKITDDSNLLTQTEKDSLIKISQELNVYLISKSDDRIYFGLWGFLDNRIGVTYWTQSTRPEQNLKQLKDRWYH